MSPPSSEFLAASSMLVSCLAYSSTLKMFLQNTGRLSLDYMELYPRRYNFIISILRASNPTNYYAFV
jgi:hypothetical protein